MPWNLLLVWVAAPIAVWGLLVLAVWVHGVRRGHGSRTVGRLIAVHASIVVVAALLLVDGEPTITTPIMTTADKVAFKGATSVPDDSDFYHVTLEPRLIDRGLRTGAELVDVEFHPQVTFDDAGRIEAAFSWRLPTGWWINADASGRAQVRQGEPDVTLKSLRIGRLPFPGWASRIVGDVATEFAVAAPITGRAINATNHAEVRESRLHVELRRRTNLSGQIAASMWPAEFRETSRMAGRIVKRWLAVREDTRPVTFASETAAPFRIARELAPDWSAARQNRAAIMAGTIVLGHPSYAQLIGLRRDDFDRPAMVRLAGEVRLYGRRDLVQHFWVSAGLVVVSSARISDSVGLTKEELDSGEGGSGFSFADLLADRAGVRFAELAIGSERGGEAVQQRLGDDWQDHDLVPPIDGLPEGIRVEDLEREYGGVEGETFREVADEIERRLDRARMLVDG